MMTSKRPSYREQKYQKAHSVGQADTSDGKHKTAEVPKDGAGTDAAEKPQPLANQAQDLRRNAAEWNGALAQGNDSGAVKAMGFPDAKLEETTRKGHRLPKTAEQDGPVFIKIAGIKTEEAAVGEFIKINVKPGEVKSNRRAIGDAALLPSIWGQAATPEQIKHHAKEIYELNFIKLSEKRFTANCNFQSW
jgi:hypothetical protein